MKPTYLVLLSVMVLSTCNKEDSYTSDKALGLLEIPKNDSLDINNDNKFDFVVLYNDFRRLSGPSNADYVTGSILPLNGNKILSKNQTDILFLKDNDTIQINDNANATWTDFAPTVIHLHADNGYWDENWTVLSSLPADYYIGIKINIDGLLKIGWLLLDINTNNGKISVLDSRLSSAPELVIK